MFNSNALWWYEYKYGDSPPNHSCHLVYIKHVHVCICNSVCCCIILHLFHTKAIICHLQEVDIKHKTHKKNNINITNQYL